MEKELAISFPVELRATAQTMVFVGLSAAAFFMPFFIGHPQWVVGTIVNACLILSAIFLPKKYIFSAVIFPSLGVMARGLVFGPFTPFLIYFLPFIWLGNLILVLFFKLSYSSVFKNTRIGFLFAVVGASLVKFLVLFFSANIYLKFHIVPAVFLQAMGLNQLATAMAGGLLALLIFTLFKNGRKFDSGN